jgi:hypothetical protein
MNEYFIKPNYLDESCSITRRHDLALSGGGTPVSTLR